MVSDAPDQSSGFQAIERRAQGVLVRPGWRPHGRAGARSDLAQLREPAVADRRRHSGDPGLIVHAPADTAQVDDLVEVR
ncbi:MAG: hypothetical protein MZU84_03455 [Sphingobacterium sp.]|nr:hypothetical protein [Sphingobacterium sp.]